MLKDQKRILVVEDEPALFKILGDKLMAEGFEILQATDGEEGLAMALKEHPDLILLDIVMPKMDGVTMLRKIRADSWGKTVPAIILTNLSPDNEMIKAIEDNEPSYYLVKADLNINDLVLKIRERLEK